MAIEQYEIEHLKQLRPYLPECTVLLRQNGDFPLEGPCAVAAYGNGVRHTRKGGTGSGEVNSHFYVDVETGLVRSGFRITTKEWLDAYDDVLDRAERQFIKEVKERARKNRRPAVMEGMGAVMPEPEYVIPFEKQCGTAVYVLSRICGEGSDRAFVKGDVSLTDTEIRDILAIRSLYERFMLVLNVGGPVDLTPVMEVENILLLSQLGVDTGLVLAQILLGKMNPSGKLTTTWASPGQYPGIGTFGEDDDTRYQEGIYVGYRYFDTAGEKALFPFGYGLSYTTFSVENVAAPTAAKQENACVGAEHAEAPAPDTIAVSADVVNTGAFAGKEVLQLYVSAPEGRLDQPYQALAGFAKTALLLPGERERVTIRFRMRDIASYDAERAAWILERGDYLLRLGTSSVDTAVCGAVRVAETMTVKHVRRALGTPDFEDWKMISGKRRALDPGNGTDDAGATVGGTADQPLPEGILLLEQDAVPTETVCYEREEPVEPVVAELTDDELIYMNIGHFEDNSGLAGVIGNSARKVCGAAGESTWRLEEKGIPALVMADGPAGLRLAKDYAQDGDTLYSGDSMLESLATYMPKAVTAAARLTRKKPPKGAERKHQYCTAIPIGTGIAQSWNTALAEQCGEIVGAEMARFGVHLWLAPALNIHRNILCGRNFEYFSEDPLITGKMAAALTRGVQKHPGRGVTVKHFAANNQEKNRFQNNSQVSERAAREIYLRGFEICVREAHPLAVMTSYNLLNGIHTNERRDLVEDILRSEFGFSGIVMTDWLVAAMRKKGSKYDWPHADRIAAAGGDLVMPGSGGDYKEIRKALQGGTLSRRQLAVNATRVYRMAKKLTGGEEKDEK